MVERAAALGAQAAAVVGFAPMRGKFAISARQIAEHELAALDIGRPGRRDRVDADREKAVPFGGDEPPSAIPPFGAEKPVARKVGPKSVRRSDRAPAFGRAMGELLALPRRPAREASRPS